MRLAISWRSSNCSLMLNRCLVSELLEADAFDLNIAAAPEARR